MKKLIRKIFPHPSLTLLLTVIWLMLQDTVSPGMGVFGIVLGTIIPFMTARWWPDRPDDMRLFPMFKYCLLVVWDIIVANVEVAWIVLTKPNAKMEPNWVVVPLELKSPEAITILAGTITLTPGTVSADLSDEGHSLLVHALDAPDPDAIRDDIKDRYERRLLEIFQ